ncbi:MAG TPA: flavodoxin family protein [Syntrophomonadaceae bacterium]|nr:flavodoxin family protein [Syntrophomonadaceae bacterium]
MFIVGINGSPNHDGNTVFLLKEALAAAHKSGAKTELLHVAEILQGVEPPFCEICSSPCDGVCGEGNKLGEASDLLRGVDGIIIGSPVYFGTLSGQLKAFWDKTRVLRREKALLNVVGGAIAVGGARFGGQETTLKAIHDMMLVQGMIIVGDGCQDFDCGHQGACAQRPAEKDENGRRRAHILGQHVLEVAGATKELRVR